MKFSLQKKPVTGPSGRKPAIQINLRKVAGEQYLSKKAGDGVRTCDLIITNDLLYQLSYTGFFDFISRELISTYKNLNNLFLLRPVK